MTDRSAVLGRALATAALLLFLGTGTTAAQDPAEAPGLYERLGGLPAIALVVSEFMDAFAGDPLIFSNPAVRERKGPDRMPFITYQVTTLLCQATGGPCEYEGRSLKEAHSGLGISPAEWDRMVAIFSQTLEQHGVPEQEQQELFEILGPTRGEIVVETGG